MQGLLLPRADEREALEAGHPRKLLGQALEFVDPLLDVRLALVAESHDVRMHERGLRAHRA